MKKRYIVTAIFFALPGLILLSCHTERFVLQAAAKVLPPYATDRISCKEGDPVKITSVGEILVDREGSVPVVFDRRFHLNSVKNIL